MSDENRNVEIFTRDVSANDGYLYTKTQQLSCHMATNRSTDAIIAAGHFTGRRVLDIGCGDGFFTFRYWDRTHPALLAGVDITHEAVVIAERHKGERLISFSVADAHRLPFADDSFDVVLLQSVLHHDNEPANMISEAFRLAPEILIHEPNGNNIGLKMLEKIAPYHRAHDEKSYSSRQLAHFIRQQQGRIVLLNYAGFVPMFCPNWLAKAMKHIEPWIEKTPVLNALGCAVVVLVARRRPKCKALK